MLLTTYLVLALTFGVFHSQGSLVALDISGINDAVVCAKFTLRARVDQSHILEVTAAHQNARLSRNWATLRLDGVDRKADLVSLVLNGELGTLALLLLRKGEDGHVVRVDLASFTILSGRVVLAICLALHCAIVRDDFA